MRIIVSKENKKTIEIFVPSKLALVVVKCAIKSSVKDERKSLTKAQKKQLSKLLKYTIKNYINWKLVEVISSDGDKIVVYL